MDADLDLLLISVYCTADDLLSERPRNARRRLSDAEVVTRREESKAMEETIRAGKCFEKSRTGAAAVSAAPGPSGENPPA